ARGRQQQTRSTIETPAQPAPESIPSRRDSSSLALLMVNKAFRAFLTREGSRNDVTSRDASVARIADQGFPRTEQDHQNDAENAEHGEHRLVQDDADHRGPEPRGLGLEPRPERLLAGLMD